METMIKGYQWRTNMTFLDEYMFYTNSESTNVHLPPNTTLIPPPTTPEGCEAVWDGNKWFLRMHVPEPTLPPPIDLSEYGPALPILKP